MAERHGPGVGAVDLNVKQFTETLVARWYNPPRLRGSRPTQGPGRGRVKMLKLLAVTGIILAAILLLVFIWPAKKTGDEEVAEAKK
jgi:hypothetical protein